MSVTVLKVMAPEVAESSELLVLVAEEHPLIRSGLKLVLMETLGRVRFVEVADGVGLASAARAQAGISLALVDLCLPQTMDGAAVADFARRRPTTPMVIMSALDSPDTERRAMAVPTVHAVVSKNAALSVMQLAIEAALKGERVTSTRMTSPARSISGLTRRQAEVHQLLCQGLSNKSIGALLGISAGTVKNHMYEIFRTLKTTNRTQAATLLHELR